ncbi:MAG: hypothetical protein NZ516_00645 [Raineya sp.]|nr:hypothetical protein [Raineya sp.]
MKKIGAILFLSSLTFLTTAQNVQILKQPASISIKALPQLNSSFREVNLNITPDGKYLFFMSSRGEMPWSNTRYLRFKGKWEADGDIWYSQRVGKNWLAPECLSEDINTSSGEDEPNISPDGKTVYFQSWSNWRENGGPYYKADRIGNKKWVNVRGLGGGINSFFRDRDENGLELATDGMTISPDGKTLVVAVGKYDGNMDLYVSFLKNGTWTYPKKLSISTIFDERSPFIAADGETLYFASNGYKGFGGLDIYKTNLKDLLAGKNPTIYNVGSPFNTAQDDYGFIVTSDGKEAYFIRDSDIYMADISQSPPEMKPNYTFIIKGIVRNARTKAPLRREINFYENNSNFATEWSKAGTGELMIITQRKINTFETKFEGDSGFKSFAKTFKANPNSNVVEIVIDLEPINQPVTANPPPQKPNAYLVRRQEEEKRKKQEEIRRKHEQEKLRNQEAACRM